MDRKRTILLIDDEVDLVAAVAFQLRAKKGYEVITAYDGVEGMKKLETIDPDLVILDINMPKMGGIEFYHNICDDKSRTRYPVLVLTARSNLEQIFIDLNADGFMSKPFELDDLMTEVERILDKKYGAVIPATRVKDEGKAKKAMVLEDDGKFFKELSTPFINGGYSINSASNVTIAVGKLMESVPDIILVKMVLPFLSGEGVVAKLQNLVGSEHTMFLIYGSEAEVGEEDASRILDMDGYVSIIRSDDPQAIFNEAEKILERRASN